MTALRKISPALAILLIALAVLPILAQLADQSYLITQSRRILIFALAAVSLNLVLGYGGMVCFGQAMFFGLGAYTVAFINVAAQGQQTGIWHLLSEPALSWACACLAAALLSFVVGLVSLRTSGVYFIMITLAFAQMIYFIFVGLKSAGGDEGLRFTANRSLAGALNLGSSVTFYYVVFAILALAIWFTARLMNARFGIVLQGARDNERRMKALGFETIRYRLAGLVISGAMAGLAGGLFATHEAFISPSIMHWSRSGELIVMVVLGGMGTLGGPIVGAIVFLMVEKFLPDFTDHWGVWFGPVLVLSVLFARNGLMGWLTSRRMAGPTLQAPLRERSSDA
ncbi:MAG TPA: branched-chain amino acid ABC transporter permease [Ramlibacter sp.]|nr:branched-chain amino acid ABC transporter permease [Ramlibacter sp.]